jgi:uncharacterized protein YndB with AHSA1/START domain
MTDQATSRLIDHRANDSSVVDMEIHIDAPREVVFDFLTIPEKAFRWMGISGEIDAVPGGAYHVRINDEAVTGGEFVEVSRPDKVSWTWGWEGNDDVPPGSTLVTFELTETDRGTNVRLTHSGLPGVAAATRHTEGWTYFVPRLAVVAAGGELNDHTH